MPAKPHRLAKEIQRRIVGSSSAASAVLGFNIIQTARAVSRAQYLPSLYRYFPSALMTADDILAVSFNTTSLGADYRLICASDQAGTVGLLHERHARFDGRPRPHSSRQSLVFQRLCGFSFKFVPVHRPAAVHDRWPECDLA